MKTFITLTATMAAITSLAVAQTPTQTPAQGQQPTAGETQQTPAGAMQRTTPAAGTGAMANDSAKAIEASDFVKKAASSGLYEVQSSQMATTASQNNEVKQFAQRMISDHESANQELKQIASRKNVEVPESLDNKHRDMLRKLQTAEGEQFDTMYVRQQQKAHKEAVQLFQRASNNMEDVELKAFATKTLPVLQQHAEMVKELPGADQSSKAMKQRNNPAMETTSTPGSPGGTPRSNSTAGQSNDPAQANNSY